MRPTIGKAAALALALAWPQGAALAISPETRAERRVADAIAEARRLVEAGRPADAAAVLAPAVRGDPGNADLHNVLGFALRKAGRLDEARASYDRALALDPAHREAREYLGELHLQRGDAAAARAELAVLERLCPSGCEAREELAAAIRAFEGR
jgi:Flp pilus assembly protein TadD